jgi:hypothetical protein
MSLHGVDSENEVESSKLRRNTESPYEMVMSIFSGDIFATIMIGFAILNVFFPGFAILFLFVFLFNIKRNLAVHPSLPFYLPAASRQEIDPNNVKPIKKKGTTTNIRGEAEGICYIGNCNKTNAEVWIPNEVMRQHIMMLGTTGSGKSVGITSIAMNMYVQGSGYSYIDGKADLKLPIEHAANAWRFNSIDNLFMINYITGNMDMWGESKSQQSNTFNFAAKGSSGTITELLKSLLDGDNDIWAKRAETFLSGGNRVLVYLRDIGELNLSIRHYLELLTPEKCALLCARTDARKDDKAFQNARPKEEQKKDFIPDEVLAELSGFLTTIPGMKPIDVEALMTGQSLKNNPTVYDQFGFISMQVIPLVNELKSGYKHIFDVVQGHIDMDDVVINRRKLLVLLPALEKSPASLAGLGRIVLAAQKSMMGGALGSEVEGDVEKNLGSRPTSSNRPFLSIADEVGYYFVPGTAIAAAQSRSIGFSMLFAAQDIPAMKKLGEEAAKETESVGGNTNIKLGGRILNEETLQMFQKVAGSARVAQIDSQEYNRDGMLARYKDQNISYVEKDRLNVRDFTDLIEGQVFMQHKDSVVRVDIPYLQSPPLKIAALNDFIPCPPPSRMEIRASKNNRKELIESFRKHYSGEIDSSVQLDNSAGFSQVSGYIKELTDSDLRLPQMVKVCGSVELYVTGLKKMLDDMWTSKYDDDDDDDSEGDGDYSSEPYTDETIEDFDGIDMQDDIGMHNASDDTVESISSEVAGRLFGTSIDKEGLVADLTTINNGLGVEKDKSKTMSENSVKRMEVALSYPKDPTLEENKEKTVNLLNDLITHFDD